MQNPSNHLATGLYLQSQQILFYMFFVKYECLYATLDSNMLNCISDEYENKNTA